MKLLFWTPLIYQKDGIPRDEKGFYLPGSILEDALRTSAIYYYIKKDKEIESRVKKYLLKDQLAPSKIISDIEKIIYQKYPVLSELKFPEKIYLHQAEIYEEIVEVFDLTTWEDVGEFKTTVCKGIISLEIETLESLERIKAISHSFCEALARMEHSMHKEHPLAENFYKPLLNKLKTWEIPLRLGLWTENTFKGNLLFFWRIKEVRENLRKILKEDIRPTRVLYLPRENSTSGWCELKAN